jgi:hypothetical protein
MQMIVSSPRFRQGTENENFKIRITRGYWEPPANPANLIFQSKAHVSDTNAKLHFHFCGLSTDHHDASAAGNHFLSPVPHLSYQPIKSVVVDGLILTSANYSLQELPAKPRLVRLLLSDVGVCKLCANSHKLASTACNQDAFCGPGKDKLNNSSHIS